MKLISTSKLIEYKDMIFNLSLKMLSNPMDAEDATQEIFLKVLKARDSFRGESSLKTWIYRIAINHLMNISNNRREIGWLEFEEDLNLPMKNEPLELNEVEVKMYLEEVKVGCTTAMLQCLKPKERVVFILGNIFQFNSKKGSDICGITEANFRKILSRLNQKLKNFMRKNCGLFNAAATCQCRRRFSYAIEQGRLNPDKMLYSTQNKKIKDVIKELNYLDKIGQFYSNHPIVKTLSDPSRWEFLNQN